MNRNELNNFLLKHYTADDSGAKRFLRDFGRQLLNANNEIFNSSINIYTFSKDRKDQNKYKPLLAATRDIGKNYAYWWTSSREQLFNDFETDPTIQGTFSCYSIIGYCLWSGIAKFNPSFYFPKGVEMFISPMGSNTYTNIANAICNIMITGTNPTNLRDFQPSKVIGEVLNAAYTDVSKTAPKKPIDDNEKSYNPPTEQFIDVGNSNTIVNASPTLGNLAAQNTTVNDNKSVDIPNNEPKKNNLVLYIIIGIVLIYILKK